MSDPTRGGYTRKRRSTQDSTQQSTNPSGPVMSPEDSLAVEAYGDRGAAFRKTAAKMGEGLEKKDEAEQGVVAKVKSFLHIGKKEP